MEAAFFRDFADRIRAVMLVAKTDAARLQLALWVEEFEQRAEGLKAEIDSVSNDAGP